MKWTEVASGIYYIGVGCLLIATSVRFLYKFIRDIEKKHDFVGELQKDIPKIKHTLRRICLKLGLEDEED